MINKLKKHPKILLTLLLIVIAAVFTSPILFSGSNIGIEDWDHHTAFLETARRSVLTFNQFPYWDPYHCGGMPLFGSPQSGVISITFLSVLLFGAVSGIKASIFIHFFIALLGSYLLARHYRYSKLASLAGAATFSLSGVIASAISVGMLPFLYATYLPFVFLFLSKAIDEKKNLIRNVSLSSFFLALTYYGGYQIPLLTLPLIVTFAICSSLTKKSWAPIFKGVLVGLVFSLLILPKLLLNLDLSSKYPRFIEKETGGYTLSTLLHFAVSPIQDIPNGYIVPIEEKVDESSLYIGLAAFILFVFGVRKIDIRLKAVFIVSLLLVLGSSLPFYGLLKQIPFYDQFRVPERFRFLLLIPISLAVASGMDLLKKKYSFESKLVLTLIIIDLTLFAGINLIGKSFIVRNVNIPKYAPQAPIPVSRMEYTYDTLSNERNYGDTFYFIPWGTEYPAVLNSKATINCYETIGYFKNSNVVKDKPIVDGGLAEVLYWSPNKIVIDIKKESTKLNLNQNYHSGWFAYSGVEERNVVNNNGLIEIETKPSDVQIMLVYKPLKALLNF